MLFTTALVLALAGCFKQAVSTGLPPGTKVVDKPWTSTWIFGLIEAKPIDVRSDCPQGVATVLTQLTFMNWLGSVVTLGIWMPRSVTITCSGSTASLPVGARVLAADATSAETFSESVRAAARLADASHAPVYLVWQPAPAITLTH
jgi:hypothetical protein